MSDRTVPTAATAATAAPPAAPDGVHLPDGAVLVALMGVSYARVHTADGGDLYVPAEAIPFLEHLRPENWYEPAWFEAHRVRLPGTSAVYAVPTKECGGTSLQLVMKYSRVGQLVPLETKVVYEVLRAEFNSPFEEFGLVEEVRRALRDGTAPFRFQEPLAIYVPPERMQLWQSGRSEARIAGKLARHPGVEIDILRDYLLVYRWLEGIDAVQAHDRGLLDGPALESLTRRAEADLASFGFRVLDMKPNHVILRTDADGGLRREAGSAEVEYGLVDHELLQRTPEYEREVQVLRHREYLDRVHDVAARTKLPAHLGSVSMFGVDYAFGRVESTGGALWVRARDASLFEFFLPERWRQTPRIRLHPVHETFATRTKDNVDLVWKVSRVGGSAGGEEEALERRVLEHGVNSPFEEIALAALLEDAGVPVIAPHAIYRTGHASHLEDRTLDWRRYRTHERFRMPDGEPVLRSDHDYVTLWRYGGGERLAGDEEEAYYGAVSGEEALRRGLVATAERDALLARTRERVAATGVEVLALLPRQLLLPLDPSGRPRREADGLPAARLCNFDFLRLPSSVTGCTDPPEGFVPPGAFGQAGAGGRTRLHDLIAAHEGELVERTLRRVLASGAPHYVARPGDDARARIEGLARGILRATHGNRGALVEYVRRILEKRLEEGFPLNEIQMALGCFEDEIWRLCVARIPERDELVDCLSTAAGLVGEAKDELGRLYLERRNPAA